MSSQNKKQKVTTNSGKAVDRIKSITSIKLKDYEILFEVQEIKSNIILLQDDESNMGNVFLRAIAKGKAVSSIDINDVVIFIDRNRTVPFEYKGKYYMISDENSAKMVVSPDNFDFTNDSEVN